MQSPRASDTVEKIGTADTILPVVRSSINRVENAASCREPCVDDEIRCTKPSILLVVFIFVVDLAATPRRPSLFLSSVFLAFLIYFILYLFAYLYRPNPFVSLCLRCLFQQFLHLTRFAGRMDRKRLIELSAADNLRPINTGNNIVDCWYVPVAGSRFRMI